MLYLSKKNNFQYSILLIQRISLSFYSYNYIYSFIIIKLAPTFFTKNLYFRALKLGNKILTNMYRTGKSAEKKHFYKKTLLM